jgi:hypothetical protein
MEFNTFAKTLLKMAAALEPADAAGADTLTKAAETILRLAEDGGKAHSIHMTFVRGAKSPVFLTVDVREKAGAADDWSSTVSMDPVETFSFDAKSVSDAKAKSSAKVAELKSKYGVAQVLENMDPGLPK